MQVVWLDLLHSPDPSKEECKYPAIVFLTAYDIPVNQALDHTRCYTDLSLQEYDLLRDGKHALV